MIDVQVQFGLRHTGTPSPKEQSSEAAASPLQNVADASSVAKLHSQADSLPISSFHHPVSGEKLMLK
jgi:hypothetical protein